MISLLIKRSLLYRKFIEQAVGFTILQTKQKNEYQGILYMSLPKYRAWIKSEKKMVPVAKLCLAPESETGIEYLDNGQARFIPVRDCEIQQALDIFDHSGNQFYFYDVILTKTGIGVLVLCEGNLGLASWTGGAYHCFCSITKQELESSEIMGNIYEDAAEEEAPLEWDQ
jgi:hypothetical protein